MTKEEFRQALQGKTVLADFSAAWCGPCLAMVPVIRELAARYDGRAEVLEINIDSQQDLATDYMVQSIPTLILFKDGKEVRRMVGLQQQSDIEKELDRLI